MISVRCLNRCFCFSTDLRTIRTLAGLGLGLGPLCAFLQERVPDHPLEQMSEEVFINDEYDQLLEPVATKLFWWNLPKVVGAVPVALNAGFVRQTVAALAYYAYGIWTWENGNLEIFAVAQGVVGLDLADYNTGGLSV